MKRTIKRALFFKKLLWVDCIGAALAGGTVLALSGWLSRLEGLPQEVLLFTGAVNLLYASFSFSLAIRSERPMRLIRLLVCANLAWVPVCLGLVATFSATATPFAFIHLVGEAVYVGGLAVLEWHHRALLLTSV
ncbi:hypothetical protein [Salisaeta longa]|uniref:hypothetical protein n=1 Tax=Salisaeta longa TaxID=503170 RepID=UPI0003B3C4F0|nr:hypothetical protein [Salisaeta longa]